MLLKSRLYEPLYPRYCAQLVATHRTKTRKEWTNFPPYFDELIEQKIAGMAVGPSRQTHADSRAISEALGSDIAET